MSLPSNIVVNPLQILSPNVIPIWMCKHIDAKIVDSEKKYYKCNICCKKGRVIYKLNQQRMLESLNGGNS
jgi:hypothetical protein